MEKNTLKKSDRTKDKKSGKSLDKTTKWFAVCPFVVYPGKQRL